MKNTTLNTLFGALTATIAVSVANMLLIEIGALTYNPVFLKNEALGKLPTELILLNFFLLTGGLTVYNFLNAKYGESLIEKYTFTISNLFLGIAVAFAFLGHKRLYTLIAFLLLFIVLFCIEYWNKTRFMYKFYRAFAIVLLPLGILNWQLITHHILIMHPNTRLPQDFGIVPIENYFYSMVFLLLGVFFLEKLQVKKV